MLIGLCGLQGSGKDTVANILVKKGFVRLSFAGLLKDVVAIIFSYDRNLLEGVTEESRMFREEHDHWWSHVLSYENFTPRRALQEVGEALRLHISPHIWIGALERKICKMMDEGLDIVVSDVRNLHEANFIKRMNGTLIKIIRDKPSWVCKDGTVNLEEAKRLGIHSTELSVFDCVEDYQLQNRADLEMLELKLTNIL